MKIDLDYLKKVLNIFIDSPHAFLTYRELSEEGINMYKDDNNTQFDDEFIFHLSLLLENQLISNHQLDHSTFKSIGLEYDPRTCCHWAIPIRLTQSGHDFAAMLQQNEVFENLKTNFKDFPFQVIYDAGKTLSTAFMKKKVKELTGFSE